MEWACYLYRPAHHSQPFEVLGYSLALWSRICLSLPGDFPAFAAQDMSPPRKPLSLPGNPLSLPGNFSAFQETSRPCGSENFLFQLPDDFQPWREPPVRPRSQTSHSHLAVGPRGQTSQSNTSPCSLLSHPFSFRSLLRSRWLLRKSATTPPISSLTMRLFGVPKWTYISPLHDQYH